VHHTVSKLAKTDSAYPKASISRSDESLDRSTRQGAIPGRLPFRESDAIEPQESEARSKPDIPVVGLNDCLDVSLKKTVLSSPMSSQVL
jgi:hypothetical protein